MRELYIFRTFALFPLIGICIPDLAVALKTSFSTLSAEHLIVDITLLVSVLVCSFAIWFADDNQLEPAH